MTHEEQPRWLDRPENLRKLYRGLQIFCLLLLLGGEATLYLAHQDPNAHHGFSFERWPGFYAGFGFLAYVLLVLISRELRKLLLRPEDYYGD